MSDFSMAEKLWDLANLITGFAVVQSLATTFTITKGELKELKGKKVHGSVAFGAALFTFFYLIAIAWCGCVGSSLDKHDNSNAWCVATAGRIVGVLLFASVMGLALLGHWRAEVEQSGAVKHA